MSTGKLAAFAALTGAFSGASLSVSSLMAGSALIGVELAGAKLAGAELAVVADAIGSAAPNQRQSVKQTT